MNVERSAVWGPAEATIRADSAENLVSHRFRPAESPSKAASALKEFEAFVLQSFIEAMLPEDSTNVFGSGLAGDTWKSMLSEKLAREVANTGQIGIAARIERTMHAPILAKHISAVD